MIGVDEQIGLVYLNKLDVQRFEFHCGWLALDRNYFTFAKENEMDGTSPFRQELATSCNSSCMLKSSKLLLLLLNEEDLGENCVTKKSR